MIFVPHPPFALIFRLAVRTTCRTGLFPLFTFPVARSAFSGDEAAEGLRLLFPQ